MLVAIRSLIRVAISLTTLQGPLECGGYGGYGFSIFTLAKIVST